MKAVLFIRGQVLFRVGEPFLRKFQIAVPVLLKPGGIQVQHVAGNIVLPYLAGDLFRHRPGGVAVPAHPQPKAPQGRQLGKTGQEAVALQNFLGRFSADHEIIHLGLPNGKLQGPCIQGTDFPFRLRAGIQEQTVALGGQEERNVHIGTAAGGAHRVLVAEIHRAPIAHDAVKPFPQAPDHFVVFQLQGFKASGVVTQNADPAVKNIRRLEFGFFLSEEGRSIRIFRPDPARFLLRMHGDAGRGKEPFHFLFFPPDGNLFRLADEHLSHFRNPGKGIGIGLGAGEDHAKNILPPKTHG